MVIKGILLDMGGTMVDDFEIGYSAFIKGCEELSIKTVSRKVYAENIIPVTKLLRIVGLNSEEGIKKGADISKKVFLEKEKEIKLFSDVKPAVSKLKANGYSLGVVSQQMKSLNERQLKLFRIAKYFDCVISFEDSPEQKPSPIPIKKALEKLGLPPSEVIFCGDMKEDILAGKAAGVMTIAVVRENGSYDKEIHGSYHTKEMLESVHPDKIFNNLLELVNFLDQNSRTK